MERSRQPTSSRLRTRGAIFVEAIIVVSTFVLLMLAMVFFKNMYLKKIATARMARATIVAFSIRGCPTNQDPSQWSSIDLDPKAGKKAPPATTTTVPTPYQEANQSQRAGDMMKGLPGAGSNGAWLNPIADLGFSMRAAATTKTGTFSKRKGFAATMESTSFVTCGEAVAKKPFEGLARRVLDQFPSIFDGPQKSDKPAGAK